MVDSVMIDPAYDGQIFRVALADIPAKQNETVRGTYELPAIDGADTVAVKIVDVLGEEVIVTARLGGQKLRESSLSGCQQRGAVVQ